MLGEAILFSTAVAPLLIFQILNAQNQHKDK